MSAVLENHDPANVLIGVNIDPARNSSETQVVHLSRRDIPSGERKVKGRVAMNSGMSSGLTR